MNGRLSEVAAATAGRLAGVDAAFAGVSIDSRTLQPGELFFALRGERFDGHAFVTAAAGRGAAAAVVEKAGECPIPRVVVEDTVAALAALARVWREKSGATVIGVGGSNGKTTTKELLASILAVAGQTLATRGNLNNHLGVPLTLLRLEAGHRFAVIEIGANHPGEVKALADIARPTIALVTNAGAEHLEGFGDLAGVARAEGEMFAALPATGVAVINADDPFHEMWRHMAHGARRLQFGIESAAEVRATSLQERMESGAFVTVFTLVIGAEQARVRLNLAGRHNVMNALAAAAAAHAAGVALAPIVAGLERVSPVNGRLQLKA
ncbi:MAG: UDP-N-acetylmuramoyl-tripeptide--D-alanyl-D-alanine ligase, partial [Steroidobacteraceae bacterium]